MMMTNGNRTTSSSRRKGCESAAVSHDIQIQSVSSLGDEELNGVQYPAIKNAPLTVEGRGYESISTRTLLFLLIGISSYISWEVSAGSLLRLVILVLVLIPGLAFFFWVMSRTSHRIGYHEPTLPGHPIEHYLSFTDAADRCRYRGHRRIDMWTFMHGYFDGTVSPNGDLLEVLEYRHDFVNFAITTDIISYVLFTVIPGILARLLPRANARDEGRVQGHYDRGDDFYRWFAGPSMINSSGLLSDPSRKESIEEMQENKMAVVCEKLALGHGGPAKKALLDLGCGFGSLAKYASVRYGCRVTGITLGQNPAVYGNAALRAAGIPEGQSRVLSMDYRDVPNLYGGSARYDAIVCLEMAEHVGIFKIVAFLRQCYDMLEDDGVMVLQVAGLRSAWQYEDIIWGLFVHKYVFPAGADASTPLNHYVAFCEEAGFEIKSIDTIGIHYSATFWRWYENWVSNEEPAVTEYGGKMYRIWKYFLASATIACRQGSANCYQITLVKNRNSTQRVAGVRSQFGILGALATPTEDK